MHMRLLALLLLTLLAGCGSTSVADNPNPDALPETLRVGLIPNIAPDKQRATYAPFGEELGRRLGVEVELFVAPSYAGVVTALAAGQLDIAYLGGLTYAQAEKQVELTPLVTEVDRDTGTSRYLSAIVVPAASAAQTPEDVVAAGGSVAFGDPSSTSGSLYPRLMIEAAGATCSATSLESCPPLSSVSFTGGHDATALAVAGGRADAGGLELRVLRRIESQNVVPPGALRVVQTREVMGYPWVGRTALGSEPLDQVRQAFLGLTDPKLLDLLRAKSYVAVTPGDYDEVRREAARLGLLT
ncbi:MAG: phosphate/phosphite/phosphonate ABC transporter substrate-binding protein [Actinomycetota bacterium]|nr:phosphate/phosphite/phosphonate ABC transporter substrate-binding protein [Actinomycetota bacterium]